MFSSLNSRSISLLLTATNIHPRPLPSTNPRAQARRDVYGPRWASLRLPGTTTTIANNNSDNDGFLRTQKRNQSLAVRPVGVVDKCRLLACLSALFPAASVQLVGVPGPSRASWMDGTEEGKAATETISGQGGGRDGVSSILRRVLKNESLFFVQGGGRCSSASRCIYFGLCSAVYFDSEWESQDGVQYRRYSVHVNT